MALSLRDSWRYSWRKLWRAGFHRVLPVSLLISLVLAAPGFSPVRASGEEPLTAGEILQRVDENRMPGPDFAFEMEITSYKNGEIIAQYTLAGYVRIREANVQALLYFLDPPKVNGQKLLMSGKEYWMHFPKTKNVIKLSPAQILLGEVANGDIMQLNFSRDYRCALLPDEDSPATVPRGAHETCLRLLLEAREDGEGTYQKILLYIDKESYLPVAGEFYARSGKLLKTAAYQDYQPILGKQVAMKVTIYDVLQTGKYTVMEYKRLVEKSLPANYFRKEYLPRFTYLPLD